jgi:hypothetical protein
MVPLVELAPLLPPAAPGLSADPPVEVVLEPADGLAAFVLDEVGVDPEVVEPPLEVAELLVPPDEGCPDPAELTSRSSAFRTPSPTPMPVTSRASAVTALSQRCRLAQRDRWEKRDCLEFALRMSYLGGMDNCPGAVMSRSSR